ncbi:hypothetical protein AMTRI_Chr03g48980 [Amborella trichopoda]
MLPESVIKNLVRSLTNYFRILPYAKSKKHPFRFQHVWTEHPEFLEVVKEVWKQRITGSPMFRIAKKLQMLKKKLKVWNKNIFGNELQDVVGTNSMIDEDEIMAETKGHNALAIQEKFWASKSRVRWLQLGDRNTKYFHSMELGDLNSIGSYCVEFYKEFFKAKGCSMNNDLFNLIPNMVDMVDNNFLEPVPSPLEIKETDIVKYDVCRAEQVADTLSKFRPICMGNFKIMPKILANRLRVIDPKLISEEQGAFLKGRQISSNICMASELLNSFPKKTYDLLEWPFLLEVLKRFGFTIKFVSWVKRIQYLANISVERGHGQGDPLAPLLFILAKEKLICTLKGPRGLRINFSKSELFCGSIPQARQYAIKRLLGVSIGRLPFKYLGVSIFLGAPKARFLRPLLERIRNKLSGWKGRILISWDKVYKPIKEGRLGLRRLRDIGNTSIGSLSGLPLSAFKNSYARVSHFISGSPQTWCFPVINSTLLNEFLTAASAIDLPHAPLPDQRIWRHTISGCKLYWNALVWYKGIHSRVSLMSWKVANNAIAIDEKIRSIGINLMETRDHLFVTCLFANSIWSWFSKSGFRGILRDSSGVVRGSFPRPIPMGTNYFTELNVFIYGVEYVIKKASLMSGLNVILLVLFWPQDPTPITTGYVVDDNIGKCSFS